MLKLIAIYLLIKAKEGRKQFNLLPNPDFVFTYFDVKVVKTEEKLLTHLRYILFFKKNSNDTKF